MQNDTVHESTVHESTVHESITHKSITHKSATNDSFYRARLLSAWDAEYKTIRHNILKYSKLRIYALADLISFSETLDHCMRQLHFTDDECAVLLQHSGDIIGAVARRMGSTYDVVLGAVDKLLGRETEE